MKRCAISLAVFAAALVLVPTAGAVTIRLTPISTPFNSPIGIDHHEPTNTVVVSVNYNSGGRPHNFERINPDGTHTQFSNAAGFSDEVKIATVRGGNPGGFTVGDLFTGNGVQGQIARITNNGATVLNPWATLPGTGQGLMRGSLHVDRTGVWGGNLIAATTTGRVYRVNSSGVGTQLANVNTHLEGLTTVPNDPARYGPLAGKIIAGAEQQNRLYAIDTAGNVQFFNLGIPIEDIDLVPANENFFGVAFANNRILGAEAGDFAGLAGDILLTRENILGGTSGLYRLLWNGTTFQTELIDLAPGSFFPTQWEHVTFTTAGIREVPPVPEPGTLAIAGLTALGLLGYGSWRRRHATA